MVMGGNISSEFSHMEEVRRNKKLTFQTSFSEFSLQVLFELRSQCILVFLWAI